MNKIAMKLAAMNSAVASAEGYDKYAALKMPNKFTKVVRRVPRSINNYFGRLTGRNTKRLEKYYKWKLKAYNTQLDTLKSQLDTVFLQQSITNPYKDVKRYNELTDQYNNLYESITNASNRLRRLADRSSDHILREDWKNLKTRAITLPFAVAGVAGASRGLSAIIGNQSDKHKANKNNKKVRG